MSSSSSSSSSVIIPPLSSSDESLLLSSLSHYGLSVSQFSELESSLRSSLLSLESSSLSLLFSDSYESSITSITSSLDSLTDSVSELSMWSSYHQSHLSLMRRGMQTIESKNNRLELQEENNKNLSSTLEFIMKKLKLSSKVVRTLESPDFSHSLKECLKSASTLESVCSLTFPDRLNYMKAIVKRKEELTHMKHTLLILTHKTEEKESFS